MLNTVEGSTCLTSGDAAGIAKETWRYGIGCNLLCHKGTPVILYVIFAKYKITEGTSDGQIILIVAY